MCGIAGIIDFSGKPVSQQELEKMATAMQHRGPDGKGFWIKDHMGFAHRRLRIFDLDKRSDQPFSGWGKTMVYNGAIYNFRELRLQLKELGYHFTTDGDTEVLLAGFDAWGEALLEKLNGMWAFAIYDSSKKQVFFSRDRFGEKPLYYLHTTKRLVFASTITAIGTQISLDANETPVLQYLCFEQCEFPENTFFKNIKKIPAGHNARLDLETGDFHLTPFYSIPKHDLKSITETEAVATLEKLLEKTVAERLITDVPLGSCLSGGIDSSALVYYADRLLGQETKSRFQTVTAIADDPAVNEKRFAEAMISKTGIKGHFTEPSNSTFPEDFEKMLSMQEEPILNVSPYMQYITMRAASKNGLKVMLDGQSADELFLGYLPHLAWFFEGLSSAEKMRMAPAIKKKNALSWMQFTTLVLYHNNLRLKRFRQLKKWSGLRREARQLLQHMADIELQEKPSSIFDRQQHEITKGALPFLLRCEDKNAMAFGVETRLPFLDEPLVDFAMNLPADLKIHSGWTKYILRQTLNHKIPETIVWRKKKIGFAAPVSLEEKVTGHFAPLIAASPLINRLMPGIDLKQLDTGQILRLTVLAIWENQMFNQPTVSW